jgi:MFS family permease
MNSSTPRSVKIRLSIMMALIWAIFGAWLPLLLQLMQNLGFTVIQQTVIGTAPAAAAMLAVFFGNNWADRHFAQEKFLAASSLVAGLALIGLFWAKSFWPFCALMYVHAFFYMPLISVTNSIALRHLKDTAREFGHVRMWGPVGWMGVSWPMYFLLRGREGAAAEAMIPWIFIVGGAAALLLALIGMFLPHTPPMPTAADAGHSAWLKALRLSGKPFLLVLLLVALIDATNHMGYFILSGSFLASLGVKTEWIMPIMGISQFSEIFVTFLLGLILVRLGWKATMVLGILAHAARFAAYSFLADYLPMIVAVQVLHGVCYACFFATLYIFIDKAYPRDVQASAQGVFNFVILGLGDLLAKWIFIPAKAAFTTEGVTNYHSLFLLPAGMALCAATLLAIAFRPPAELRKVGEIPLH